MENVDAAFTEWQDLIEAPQLDERQQERFEELTQRLIEKLDQTKDSAIAEIERAFEIQLLNDLDRHFEMKMC